MIRAACTADLPFCAEIVNAYIDATDWLPRVHSHQQIEAMFEPGLLDRRSLLVAEQGGEIAGYASLEREGSLLHALYLKPGLRNMGLGKALLDSVKRLAPSGFDLRVFEPNRDARRFYRREGLVEVPDLRSEEAPEGIAVIGMRWSGHASA